MYKQKVLDKFYEELFSTDFNDYETPTQNAKTDVLCDNIDISFEDWLDELIETFCRDNDYEESDVKKAVEKDSEFREDLKSEYEYLKEEVKDILDEEESDD